MIRNQLQLDFKTPVRPNIDVRVVMREDVPALIRLWQRFVACETGKLGKELYPKMTSKSKEDLQNYLESLQVGTENHATQIFMAWDGRIPVGYLRVCICEREIGLPRYYLVVQEMYIEPEYRHRFSIARKLYWMLKGWLKDWNVLATVTPEMPELKMVEVAAIPVKTQVDMYLRKGFKPYAILMRKEL